MLLHERIKIVIVDLSELVTFVTVSKAIHSCVATDHIVSIVLSPHDTAVPVVLDLRLNEGLLVNIDIFMQVNPFHFH